jgi:diaminopimelate decarboxylase
VATKHSYLTYQKNELTFYQVHLKSIAEQFATPFFLYHQSLLESHYQDFQFAAEKAGLFDPLVCFALKANSNIEILKILSALGAGADVVSGGELRRAMEAGVPPSKIVFSGVGKTSEEIEFAVKNQIYSFNVESIEELIEIHQIASRMKLKARVAFRLNPMVTPKTHKYISTGNKTHKFGMLQKDVLSALKLLPKLNSIKLVGLSVHIGSQLLDLKATQEAVKKISLLALKIPNIEFLDVGGGLGVDYHPEDAKKMPSILDYMELISRTIQQHYLDKTNHPIRVVFEPGRKIVAKAGLLVMKVLRQKKSDNHLFTIVDGGMNDFVRPSLYEAYHELLPLNLKPKKIKTTVVGPICETSDCFAHQRSLSKVEKGDYLVLADTGAYGYSMGSQYNLRPRPSEILITKDQKLRIINFGQKYEELS